MALKLDEGESNAAPLPPTCPPIVLSRSASFVVVGGGPAGIHFASLLAKLGITNVTVVEAESHVGGKSWTHVDSAGVPHEMGTCYLHALYGPIRELIAEYDPENKEVGLENEMAFGTDLRAGADNDYENGKEFSALVLEKAEEVSGIPRSLWDIMPDKLQYVSIAAAIVRYSCVHRDLFGEYEYGLPPRPRDWSAIDMPAVEFLEKHDLMAITTLLRYAQQLQGYGVLEDIPAFYMLWWIHPKLLEAAVPQTITGGHGVTMLSKGYQSLWASLAKHHINNGSIRVITNAKVTSVTRGEPNASVTYTNTRTKQKVTLKCDYVIMALDMSRHSSLIKDITRDERLLFSQYAPSVLCTTLYESEELPHEFSVELWINRMRPDAKRDGDNIEGRLHAHRNSANALERPLPGRQRRVAYQYLGRTLRDSDPDMLDKQLRRDLALAGERNVTVIEQHPWPYMPQFNTTGLREAFPWRILAMQGSNRTVFVGSSVAFESVVDCVQYNHLIAKSIIITGE